MQLQSNSMLASLCANTVLTIATESSAEYVEKILVLLDGSETMIFCMCRLLSFSLQMLNQTHAGSGTCGFMFWQLPLSGSLIRSSLELTDFYGKQKILRCFESGLLSGYSAFWHLSLTWWPLWPWIIGWQVNNFCSTSAVTSAVLIYVSCYLTKLCSKRDGRLFSLRRILR